jgi:DNA polymerase-3 subunit alpha
MTAFVHLHVHSEFSLVDGVVRIGPLMKMAAEAGMPAVALTDQCNLFGMVRFYKAAMKAGLKPIIGVDAWLEEPDQAGPARMSLLCQDEAGYRNLCRLVSRSYLKSRNQGRPLLRKEWFREGLSDGLIVLSGGKDGDVGRALVSDKPETSEARIDFWRRHFPDRYYLEVRRTGRSGEDDYNRLAIDLAARSSLPVVATNDVRFLKKADFEAHEARVCIQQGRTLSDPGRPRAYSDEQYLKTPDEMALLFSDLPEALANTVEIAKRCSLGLTLGESVLPEFPVPKGMTAASYLRESATEALSQRKSELLIQPDEVAKVSAADYDERLATELDVICGMGYPGYFLIVADFIQWAKDNGVPVGPGRGSGAGSLVAYVLGITDLDPLRYELLFERFLNPERVSMPDFDIDFCMDGRDRVIDYVADRYGRQSVSQIITFGTMAARAVVRDVGRILGHPYGFVDRIAKLVPFEIGMTLEKALDQDEELQALYHRDDEVRTVIDLARQLEGLARNAGKHAGGVVIAPGKLTDFTPLYCEEGGSSLVSQYDKDDVEAVGLVKFDFLGLRTLTVIDRAVATINDARNEGEPVIDIRAIALDDRKTYELLKSHETTAVFQLESRGMKDLIKRLQPDSFDDIIALVALFRPGPLQSGMVDDFINRKHGRNKEPVDYFHPDLKPILKPTHGVILYQEQVMQIAQVLAGYSLGAADLLRRAMGKKKPEEMAKQRSIFVQGAVDRGVAHGTATYIFDLMEKFAGYGFNKSHSAAYALLAYQTAWLKTHFPEAFMSAVLSADMDHTDKVVTLIDECVRMGLNVEPPDINKSRYMFAVSGAGALRYGLGAIKGVGQGAVESIIEERMATGEYDSLVDLCTRADLHKANRRVMEALIRAGALDTLGPNRATLMHQLPTATRRAEQHARAEAAGQSDLFGVGVASPAEEGIPEDGDAPVEVLADWSDEERLAGERETLGLYLTGHPIDAYLDELGHLTNGRIADVAGAVNPDGGWDASRARREIVLAGLVIDMRKRGNRVSLILDDKSGRIEVTLFDDVYQEFRHLVAKDTILVVEGNLRFDDFIDDWRLTAKRVMDMNEARQRRVGRLLIKWRANGSGVDFVDKLKGTLRPYIKGSCPVSVIYEGSGAGARLALGDDWSVQPTDELMQQLFRLVGSENVKLIYGRKQGT